MSRGFAVLALHFQNAVVHPDGAIGRRGNAEQIQKRDVLCNVRRLFASARAEGVPIIHVACTIPPEPGAAISSAPMFSSVFSEGVLEKGSWGAAFHDDAAPAAGEAVVHHAGILSFPDTALGDILKRFDITKVAVCGVATRLVVEAAVFELTDRAFETYVVEDCCASARAEHHEQSLDILRGLAAIVSSADVQGLLASERKQNGRT